MTKILKNLRVVAAIAALFATTVAFTGCEDDGTTVHKITLHNKSSYTVTQKISGYGDVVIPAGDKRSFDDVSLTLYAYSPSSKVIRIKESSHTFVYKNR